MTPGQRTLIDYGSAVAAVLLAWLARQMMQPLLEAQAPNATFLIAVIFTAWRCGLGPALLAMFLGYAIGFFFFIPPYYEFAKPPQQMLVTGFFYFLISISIAVVSEVLRRAHRRADGSAKEADGRRQELEREIAERKGIEAALREQQAWFRVTFHSIADAVLTTNGAGQVAYLNPVAEELTGWSQEDAAGQPLDAVFRLIHEHTRQPLENPVAVALREDRAVGISNHSVLVGKEGRETPIDDSAAPIRDDDDKIIGGVLVFRDVTQRRQSEAAARHAASIVDFSDDAIFSKSNSGIVLSWNKGAENLYGYSADEIVGKSVELLFPPGEQQQLSSILEQLRQGQRIEHFETVRRRKDGTLVDVSVNISPLRDAEGHVIGASTIARGIARQKAVEAEIRRLNRDLQQWISEFQTLLDVIPISIAVTDDPDCRRIWTNPTMARLLHLPQDANASLSAPPSERPTTYRVFQNGRELPTERLPLHVATATEQEVREMEIDLVLDDGTVVNMLSFSAPLFDESGKVRGGIFAGIDLTDRKQAEQALRRSEQELSDFFENATVGLHWSGPDGVILRANRAELEMLGYDRHEYIGQHVAEFHVDQEAAANIMTRLQNGERLHDVPAQLQRKDGSILDVLIDSSVMWEDGRFIHTRTFMRDITQRKRAEQRRNLELAVTQILADTSDTADSILQIMRVICQELGWEVGAFWRPDDDDAGLTCLHVGCPEDASFGEFASATRGRTFRKGQGLPGRVWSTGQPSWIAEVKLDDNFPRAPAALASGLRSGLGVPVLAGREFLGVLEFFSRRSQSPDFELLDLLGSIAGKIGQCLERQTSQQELQESAERLRLALSAGKMGTWEWAVATGKVIWSPNLEAIHGMAPGTFPGTFEAYQEDIHPYDRDFVVRSLTQTLEKGEDHRIEYRIIWPDGSIHWVEARGKVFRDTAGKPIRLIGVCIDIDERERLETELRRRVSELAEAEGRVRSVVDNVIDGIITINESGTIETVNPAAEEVFGYAAREMVGKNVRVLMPEPFHSEHDGYLSNYFRTGQPKIIGIGREVIGQRKDGSTFPMDLAVGEFQLRDRKFFTGVVRDITERKHNEQTLRFLADASAALAGLLDYESTLQRVAQLAVPFFADWCSVDMLEPEGNVRRVASAGNDPDKVRLAEEIYRRFPPDPNLPYGVGHILRTSQPELVPEITDELLAMSVNGNQEMLDLMRRLGLKSYMGLPLRIRGQALGVITFMTAESGRIYRQTDLELAEDLARRAAIAIDNAQLYAEVRRDKRKDEFLATLAHELRNPLTPIRNSLQVMQMSAGSQPAFEGVRSTMERQIDQMVRLIDDLLDVSRITRNKLELRLEQVDLAEVIASAVETCRPLIDEAKHDLQLSLPGSPILLHADFTRLAQVFANLLNNACKYTEPGGKIAVVAKRTGDQVEVRVQDTGIGISPESLPNIFDMFTQVDASLERSQGGLGIGLTLVRRLVEMHGGSVSARSEGKGRGTEFIVRLPASVSPKPAARHEGSPSLPAALLPKRKILVVDDNKDAADTMSMILKMLGNEVQTVYDGLAALEAVDTFQPSMLLLDIGLPKMNGYDVARNIRAKHGPSIVLAALTGWGQDEDRRRSKEAGFDHHLVKPASAAMLRNLLASLPVS